ncbi:MAG TPA: biotin/lipoyl-containing protein [Pyrinomonadaceae bacterium]|nr:biotin/lipoyl-containing protein [Pyrinomonadaceae bacterium]
MATEVAMPQMGESITEGTITKWLKKVGDKIERDEMIFEISTDKVDAEIPSPVAGVLLEIRGNEGETLEVGTVVALVGEEGEAGASTGSSAPQEAAAASANGASATVQTNQTAQTSATPQAQVMPESTPQDSLPQSENHDPQPDGAETFIPQAQTAVEVQPAMEEVGARSTAGATEVAMPQMGESITEGTITKWLKKVGDRVERDEMIFEISTDKVDAEIPSPVAGVLLEIRGNEGETLEVGTVVALVGEEGATAAPQQQAAQATAEAMAPETPEPKAQTAAVSTTKTSNAGHPEQAETAGRSYDYGSRPDAAQQAQATPAAPATAQTGNGKSRAGQSVEELRKTRSSPLVRKIAEEHGIDISRITGTGASGRVTRDDIMNFISSGAALTPDLAMKTAQTGAALPVPQTV